MGKIQVNDPIRRASSLGCIRAADVSLKPEIPQARLGTDAGELPKMQAHDNRMGPINI